MIDVLSNDLRMKTWTEKRKYFGDSLKVGLVNAELSTSIDDENDQAGPALLKYVSTFI